VTRYDYVRADIDGQWSISPLAPPGTGLNGTILDEIRSAVITQHIFTESITWNPCPRFYVQGDFSYVKDETNTPADIIFTGNTLPSIVDSQNDYWTARVGVGFTLDEKTDLHAEYSYYRADNYEGNGIVGMPYGMGAKEHTVGASISREIMKNVRLKLQYGYYHYRDETSGGHNNYDAHAVFSSLQFRF
jgi:predicted porin